MSREIAQRRLLLPCKLTIDELAERRTELVNETRNRELRESHLQAFRDRMKSELKTYEADVMASATRCFRLATVIDSGVETREVAVVDLLADTGSTVSTVRTDTGEEIERRAATAAELQAPLELGGGEPWNVGPLNEPSER